MKINPYLAEQLPPKNLDWVLLIPWIGKAREALARFDENLKNASPKVLEILKWKEAIASLETQKIKASLPEILRYLKNEPIDEERGRLLQKIVNAKKAIDFSFRWPSHKPLNTQLYCQLHKIAKQDGLKPGEIGKLRKRQNWIGREGCKREEAYFFPPEAKKVRALLSHLNAYAKKTEMDPLVQTAIVFAQFLIIHPFMDGNGRVARILIPLLLKKKKVISKPYLFLSSYFVRHHLAYYRKLFALSESKDWNDWVIYFLKGIIEEATKKSAFAIDGKAGSSA